MKKITIVLAAFVPAIIGAKPFSALPPEDVKVLDESRWGNAINMGGPSMKAADDILRKVNRITELLKTCTNDGALIDPEKGNLLQQLLESLTVPIATADSFDENDARGDSYRRGIERANRLVIMSQSIGKMSKKTLRWLINDVISFKLVERRFKWKRAIETFESWEMSARCYRKIDLGYEKFMNGIDTMIFNKSGEDVTGSEAMMAAGLGDFVKDDGKPAAWLDTEARLVDRYLAVMNKEEQGVFADYVKKIKDTSSTTLAALEAEHSFFEEYAIKLYPKDRETFARFYAEWSRFLDCLDERLVKESEKLIAQADDESGEVGKLRHCSGFSPHGAFLIAGSVQSSGCPGYTRRIRRIFEECRSRYLKHLEALRRRNPDDARIPKGWQ